MAPDPVTGRATDPLVRPDRSRPRPSPAPAARAAILSGLPPFPALAGPRDRRRADGPTPPTTNDYLAVLLGVACAAGGGELFVRGAVGLARQARVAPGLVAATVAAFATSSPELSIAVSAGLAGRPEISLGDALGSNVVNVALVLVLALALVVSGISCPRGSVRRDFPMAAGTPLLTAWLLLDGVLSRLDALLLLALFAAWLGVAAVDALRQRDAAPQAPPAGAGRGWATAAQCAAGLLLLTLAGRLIVGGARGIAADFGIDAFVVGATVVAAGTSVPELATAVVAKLRGHDEVGLGTILGSNVFNGAFIVSVAALIAPIAVGWREVATTLAFGVLSLALAYPPRDGHIGRWRGVLLLALYGVYVAAILRSGPG